MSAMKGPVSLSKTARSQARLALLAICAQLFLPAVHVCLEHFETETEVACAHSGEAASLDGAERAANSESEYPHDPDSCPLCQSFFSPPVFVAGPAAIWIALERPSFSDPQPTPDQVTIALELTSASPRGPPVLV